MGASSEPDGRPAFPTYLLPSLSFNSSKGPSFKRRKSSTATNATAPSLSTSPTSPAWSATTTPSWSATTSPSSSPPPTSGFKSRYSISSLAAAISFPFPHREQPSDEPLQTPAQDLALARTAPDTLKCSTCSTDFAFTSQIVSKGFTGRHGRAYLVAPPHETYPVTSSFGAHRRLSLAGGEQSRRASAGKSPQLETSNDLINVRIGRSVTRQLVTGAHVVADVSCKVCGTVVGWRYVDAREESQKYKIGKYILETMRVVRGVGWEDASGQDGDDEECDADRGVPGSTANYDDDDEIAFDSEDDDECEELFAGLWDKETVKKRRARKVGRKR